MKQRHSAYLQNVQNILSLCDHNKRAKFIDLGCDDGDWTSKVAECIGTSKIFGFELIEDAAKEAKTRGVKVAIGDLNDRLPYKDDSFDVVHSNQVIEHLNDTDLFLEEIYRILRPGGYAIISTENLSSWHNIFALILGFMPFSLTNVSQKAGAVGNPLAPHMGEGEFFNESTWQHQRIFTIRGLKDLTELHGFKFEKVLGAGYYPLGDWMSKIDPNHSAFISIKIRKA